MGPSGSPPIVAVKILPACFRGGRPEQGEENTIRHEYECFCALENDGVRVPRIYGYCENPVGFLMAYQDQPMRE